MSRTLPKVILICETCGNEFKVQPHRKDTARFCSRSCVRFSKEAIVKAHEVLNGRDVWNKGNNSQIKLECQTCGKEFYVDPWRKDIAKFCSHKCKTHTQETKNKISQTCKKIDMGQYNRKPKIKLICQRCNKEFYVNSARQNAKFCSRQCSDTNNRKRKVIVCQMCSKEFYVNVARVDTKFCSKKCSHESYKKQVKVMCQVCGKEFYQKPCHAKNRKFCSKSCYAESVRGSNSYLWRGGISFEEYGKEFNNKLRNIIRKRDNYTCQECGKDEGDLDRKLDIHHIDFCKTNNNVGNLIGLCNRCHTKTIANREYWIVYYQNKMTNKEV